MAAAWGQDPSVSEKYQSISLDLGTVVLPFNLVRVKKKVDKEYVVPGDTLTYTIRIINLSNKKILGKTLTLFDNTDPYADYVEESSRSGATGQLVYLPDDDNAETPFPLDEGGHLLTADVPRRGGTYDISFECVVQPYEHIRTPFIRNFGQMKSVSGAIYPYEAISFVDFRAQITITNTVYLGHDNGSSCDTGKVAEKAQGDVGDPVTYCLKVTNTGLCHLDSVVVVDQALEYMTNAIGKLLPGESVMLSVPKSITATMANVATVTANPTYYDGSDIVGMHDVTASDPSAVEKIFYSPNIEVQNKGKWFPWHEVSDLTTLPLFSLSWFRQWCLVQHSDTTGKGSRCSWKRCRLLLHGH